MNKYCIHNYKNEKFIFRYAYSLEARNSSESTILYCLKFLKWEGIEVIPWSLGIDAFRYCPDGIFNTHYSITTNHLESLLEFETDEEALLYYEVME